MSEIDSNCSYSDIYGGYYSVHENGRRRRVWRRWRKKRRREEVLKEKTKMKKSAHDLNGRLRRMESLCGTTKRQQSNRPSYMHRPITRQFHNHRWVHSSVRKAIPINSVSFPIARPTHFFQRKHNQPIFLEI